MLVSLGGCDSQVAGHVRGNLNVGNTRATLLDVLTQLFAVHRLPRSLNGLRVLDDIGPLLTFTLDEVMHSQIEKGFGRPMASVVENLGRTVRFQAVRIRRVERLLDWR